MRYSKTPPSQYYISKEDLNRSVAESQAQGQMTEEMGRYVMKIHERVCQTFPRFKGYSAEVKEEIMSWSILKLLKYDYWKRLDPAKGSIFAYLTQSAYLNMLTALGLYYKEWNKRRELVKDAMEQMKQYFSSINYIPSGWEEACRQIEREYGLTEEESTLQDEEEENEAT